MSRWYRWPFLALACVAAAGLGVYLIDYLQRPPEKKPPAFTPPPEQPRIPGTHLTEVAVDLDLADPAKPVDPVVFVEPPDMYEFAAMGLASGLLRRELYRQGVVMAAREGLGLAARDATLGEEPPDDLPPGNRLRVNSRIVASEKTDVKVECGSAAASRLVWRAEWSNKSVYDTEKHLQSLTAAEALSRGGFVTALKKAGLRGQAVPAAPAAAVPAAAEAWLGGMSVPDQVAALRMVHALVREKGESPATLVALARAYANLGMLTDRQLDGMTWVFKARSLLYAERLRARDESSPLGHWARAYAAALAGLHKIALDDFAAAAAARGAAAVPAWAGLSDALCRFDTATLEAAAAAGGPLAETAAVFQYLTVESPRSMARTVAAGRAALGRVPDCDRVHAGLEELLPVGMPFPDVPRNLDAFTAAFPGRVRKMPGLPAAVADGLAEADLIRALAVAGKARADRGEPTWGALGQFARETRLAQADRRLQFVTGSLGADGADDLAALRPLVAGHPMLPLLEAYCVSPARDPAGLERRVRQARPPALTVRHAGYLRVAGGLGGTVRFLLDVVAQEHGDGLYFDATYQYRNPQGPGSYAELAPKLFAASPHSPLVRSLLIKDVWAFAGPRAAAWEAEAQHADIFSALAQQSAARGDFAAAERQAAAAVKLAPQLETYQALAESRRANGDAEGYVAALTEFLKVPGQGLKHTRARVDIADHYLARKEYEKARPHAEAAAASGAAWGMDCAARCAEGRGDWAAAEQLMRDAAERYAGCKHYWYYWCLRTGRGDAASARADVERYLAAVGPPRLVDDMVMTAVTHAAAGRPAESAALFRPAADLTGEDFFLLVAIAEFDAAGDAAKRAEAVAAADMYRGDYRPAYEFVRDWLAKGPAATPPTRDEIDAALKPMKPGFRLNAYYVVGRLLQTRGKNDLAAHYFREAVPLPPDAGRVVPVLAALALRELEKK